MGDSKTIKKFMRLLTESEKDHFYTGTILEFDVEDYVPRERHNRGMIVDSKAGTRRIVFYDGRKKYIKDSSSLQIGDNVIIISKAHSQRSNTYIPSIIMVLANKVAILAFEPENFKFEGWIEYTQATSLLIAFIVSFVYEFVWQFDFFMFLTTSSSSELPLWIGLILVFSLTIFFTVSIYDRNNRKGRVVRCDSDTWNFMSEEVTKRFSISIT